MKYFIGMDPGIKGAVALVDGHGGLHEVFDMPTRVAGKRSNGKDKETVDCNRLASIINDWNNADPCYAVIERVQASPGAGGVSMFSFGEGYGKLQGVCAGLAIESVLATPQSWKKHYELTKDKGEARALATTLWPEFSDTFRLVKHDGRAEAALIANYGNTVFDFR